MPASAAKSSAQAQNEQGVGRKGVEDIDGRVRFRIGAGGKNKKEPYAGNGGQNRQAPDRRVKCFFGIFF